MKWLPTYSGSDDWPFFGLAGAFMQMFAAGVFATFWYVRVYRATSVLVMGMLFMLTGLFGGVAGLWRPTQVLFVRLFPLMLWVLFVSLVWASVEAIPAALRIRAERIAQRNKQDSSETHPDEAG